MSAGSKLAAYGLLLVALFAGGAAAGNAAGPIDVGGGDHADGGHDVAGSAALPAGGLLVSQDGYTIVPEGRTIGGGELAFTIAGPDGHAVRDYDELHDRELHLVVASRDLTQFTHVHPQRDADGRWHVDLPALPAGSYRAFADFQPAGAEQYTLGVDVVVPGAAGEPATLRPQAVDTVDGYEVTLDGDTTAGEASEVTVTVRRDGEVVATDPYLGAAGHLVAIRDGDLAYLHVHPLDDEPSGPVRFAVEFPSRGVYALFFDFLVDGDVRTARFVVGTEHA